MDRFRVPSAVDEVFYIPDFVNKEEEEYLQRKIIESSNMKWKALPNRRLQIWGGELTASNALIPQQLPAFVTEYPDIIKRLRKTGVFVSSKHGEPNHIIVNEYQPGQGIMPHEDGPSYHPVVATLSLGSHAVFNYYQYLPEHNPSEVPITAPGTATSVSAGKAIDPQPVLSLLLERRSLVITAKALYTHHLHAVEAVEHDTLLPAQSNSTSECEDSHELQCADHHGVGIANWEMLSGDRESQVAREGGVLERGKRISLTCRDVEHVAGGKALEKIFTKK